MQVTNAKSPVVGGIMISRTDLWRIIMELHERFVKNLDLDTSDKERIYRYCKNIASTIRSASLLEALSFAYSKAGHRLIENILQGKKDEVKRADTEERAYGVIYAAIYSLIKQFIDDSLEFGIELFRVLANKYKDAPEWMVAVENNIILLLTYLYYRH